MVMITSTEVGHCLRVPRYFEHVVRALPSKPQIGDMVQIGDDIWVTRGAIDPHCDDTAPGLVTYGMILVNDGAVSFLHDGKDYCIPPGTLYRMDGRVEHGTRERCGNRTGQLFAALIWDMPPVWSLKDFATELGKDWRLFA